MVRQFLAIAALLGVLAVACGKVGPPVRVRSEPTAAESLETAEQVAAPAAEESEEKEKQP
jgi:hypothetical protein